MKLRDNKQNVIASQIAEVLKVLGLDADAINAGITNSDVEDVAILLSSNLISIHMDQLAYNYAFFDYMQEHTMISSISSNLADVGGTRLGISKDGIFNAGVYWSFINEVTDKIGVLTKEYTYEIQNNTLGYHYSEGVKVYQGVSNNYCDYIIRKRTSPTTYNEIYVSGLSTSYTISASEGDAADISQDTLRN